MQNEDCRLQTTGKMREETAGKMSALVEVRSALLFRVVIGKFVY